VYISSPSLTVGCNYYGRPTYGASFFVHLKSKPVHAVSLFPLIVDALDYGKVSKHTFLSSTALQFDRTNWGIAQYVTINANTTENDHVSVLNMQIVL
jgi:hypothetical protein